MADPYEAAVAQVRAVAKDALRSLGLEEDQRGEFREPFQSFNNVGKHDVWSMNSRRLVVPTKNVLMTNVVLESQFPPGMKIQSTFDELWALSSLSVEELRKFPLHAFTADGREITLRPVQLAAIAAATRGTVSSSFRIEISSESLEAAGLSADQAGDLSMRLEGAMHQELLPSFNWFISTMGSGKTLMTIIAAARNAVSDWEVCKREFPFWSRAVRTIDPHVQIGANSSGQALSLKRAVLVVADKQTRTQWIDVLRANLPVIRAMARGLTVKLWPKKGYALGSDETFERLQEQDDSTVVFMCLNYRAEGPKSGSRKKRKGDPADDVPYTGKDYVPAFDVFCKHYVGVGVAAAILDEFARNGDGITCPSGRPLVYRSYGVSATPSSITRTFTRSVRLENLARSMLCPLGLPASHESRGAVLRMGEMRVNWKAKEVRMLIDYVSRFAATDPLMGIRPAIAATAATMMPPAVEVFNVRVEKVSLATMLKYQPHDMIAMPLSSVVQRLTDDGDNGASFSCAANGAARYVEVNDVRDALTRVIDDPAVATATTWQGLHRHKTLISKREFFRTLIRKAATCCVCLERVRSGPAFVSSCCSGIFCAAHASGTCGFCSAVDATLSAAEKAPVVAGSEREWFHDAMRGIQDERSISFSEALTRCTRVARGVDARCFLVFVHMWSKDIGVDRKSQEVTKYSNILRAACPEANVLTMFHDSGVMMAPGGRQRVIDTFKGGDGVRILLLHDDEGDKEQITGLDLGMTDCIVSIGKLTNPQQAYSRCLRASEAPRDTNVPIIRVGADVCLSTE